MNYFGTKTFRHIDKHWWLYAFAVIPFLVSIAYFFGEYLEKNYPILGSFGIFVLMIIYLAWLTNARIEALEEKEKLDKEYEAECEARYQGCLKAKSKEREEFLNTKDKIEKIVRE